MANPLARVVMNNVIKRTNTSNENRNFEEKVNNLTYREQEMIIGIIEGKRQVKEGEQATTIISLDEAAERVKGNK